ncbi:LytR/AlgR family response regulator transcription factor [Flagellimonas sp. S174]|uniref:LytR/AlgR family response regulator transcription factor n=1 Tax=Flagellimonas sp. S174 TaxID=3410790 RepID=UPI003BF4CBCF
MWANYLGKYKDWLLCLILIPVINTINYHLTYGTIRWDWYTYATYFIDTAQGFIAWWLLRVTIVYLDKKMPYEKGLSKRLIVQILLTNLIVQGFIILATEIINALYTDKPLPIKFYTYNLFIFFIWILVINGLYIGIYFYDEWRSSQKMREQDKALRQTGFEVGLGNKKSHIPFSSIAWFFVDERTTYLITQTGQSFVLDDSLNKIMPKLPEELFFRLNRKYIVNRNQLLGYKKEVNGKLAVEFGNKTQPNNTEIVSRTTAPEFKKWFSLTVHSV